jgi:hypothetical protein
METLMGQQMVPDLLGVGATKQQVINHFFYL